MSDPSVNDPIGKGIGGAIGKGNWGIVLGIVAIVFGAGGAGTTYVQTRQQVEKIHANLTLAEGRLSDAEKALTKATDEAERALGEARNEAARERARADQLQKDVEVARENRQPSIVVKGTGNATADSTVSGTPCWGSAPVAAR